MKAVTNLKYSNLSWVLILRHFKTFPKIQNANIKSLGNEKNVEFSKSSITLSDVKLDTYNFPVIDIPSTGEFLTLQKSIKNAYETSSNKILNDFVCDRYTHQIETISQVSFENNNDLEDTAYKINSLECTVHTCMKNLRGELKDLFPDRDIMSEESPLSVVCLNHHTTASMSSWDSSVSQERTILANIFVKSSIDICSSLQKCGFWADFIDPFSGTPHFGTHTNDTLFETDPRMRNFGLQIEDLGCCKVLCHPVWKENVFSGLIFTDAPSDHPILSLLNQ